MSSIPDFKNNVRSIIETRGFKHKAIAEKAGLNAKQFSDILNGRRSIDAVELWNISMALGVTPNDLFGINPKNEKGA